MATEFNAHDAVPRVYHGTAEGALYEFLIRNEAADGPALKPYPGPEATKENPAMTIGYGHLLTKDDVELAVGGLSPVRAFTLLQEDVGKMYDRALKDVNKKYGEGTFESLPPLHQAALVEITFNVKGGPPTKTYPGFTDAIVKGDVKEAIAQSGRTYEKDGETVPLTNRVKDFIQTFLQEGS